MLPPDVRALVYALSFGPRTHSDLRHNEGADASTIDAATAAGVVRVAQLRMGPFLCSEIAEFLSITSLGVALLRTRAAPARKAA